MRVESSVVVAAAGKLGIFSIFGASARAMRVLLLLAVVAYSSAQPHVHGIVRTSGQCSDHGLLVYSQGECQGAGGQHINGIGGGGDTPWKGPRAIGWGPSGCYWWEGAALGLGKVRACHALST